MFWFSFSIGKYKDKVLYDVISIHATHLFLGRPWQFNRKAKYDEFKEKYSLKKDEKSFILVPLSHWHIYEDQLKIKKKRWNQKFKTCENIIFLYIYLRYLVIFIEKINEFDVF